MKLHPLPTIRSPSFTALSRSRQSIDLQKSPSRVNSPPKKSILIARKVHSDDLYGGGRGSIMKQNISGLTQIKEEKIDSPETVSQSDQAESEVFQFNEQPKAFQSIFQTDALISPKYREHGVGPSYKNGKLVNHSIVGSTVTFEKYKKSLRQRMTLRTLHSTELDAHTEIVVPRSLKYATSIVLKDEVSSGKTTAVTNNPPFPRKMSIRNKPREVKKEFKVTKEDLTEKIEEMKKTQEDFYKTQTMGYNKLTLNEKLSQTKEERRLESFNNTMENWQKMTEDMSKRAGRSPETSVMSRNASFRGKREIVDLIEDGKTESEKLGEFYWHTSLRNYGNGSSVGKKDSYGTVKDLPGGFHYRTFNSTMSHFQMIRQSPKVFGMTMTTGNGNFEEKKQIDRTYNEYLDNKMSKLGKLIKKIKPVSMGPIDDLIVEGRNKLDMEATLIWKDEEAEDFAVPNNFLQPKNEERVDQTIHENYERTMISRNGRSGYL